MLGGFFSVCFLLLIFNFTFPLYFCLFWNGVFWDVVVGSGGEKVEKKSSQTRSQNKLLELFFSKQCVLFLSHYSAVNNVFICKEDRRIYQQQLLIPDWYKQIIIDAIGDDEFAGKTLIAAFCDESLRVCENNNNNNN